MSAHSDRTIGGDWFSTVWIDKDVTERIDISFVDSVLIVDIPKVELSRENVKELRLTLERLERWLRP